MQNTRYNRLCSELLYRKPKRFFFVRCLKCRPGNDFRKMSLSIIGQLDSSWSFINMHLRRKLIRMSCCQNYSADENLVKNHREDLFLREKSASERFNLLKQHGKRLFLKRFCGGGKEMKPTAYSGNKPMRITQQPLCAQL